MGPQDRHWFHAETGDIHGPDGHAAVLATAWQPGYVQPQQPGGPVVYVQQPTTNGLAIASLVLGIVWLYWIGSILALIFGYVAKGQIDRSGGTQSGRGLAIAGIVLGWVELGILVIVLLIVAGYAASASV
jgi:hypothetical protein